MLADFFGKKTTKALNAEKLRVLTKMAKTEPGTDEYHKLMKELTKLDGIDTGNRRAPFKWDTVIMGGVGLISTAMLMLYETRHVISQSKAWNERPRPETPK